MKKYANGVSFPYLPEGREIYFVGEDDPFMKLAFEAREESNERQFPTGAVAVNNGQVIAKSHNRSGYTWKWLINFHRDGFCPRRWFKAKTGTKYWMCPGCAGSNKHAESGLVLNAEREGRLAELEGADLYLAGHWWCCKPCWDNMTRAGIRNVYILKGAKEKFDSRKW